MPVDVKICGLSDEAGLDAAVEHGARWVGLVFYPPSPRAVTPGRAAELARRVPDSVGIVGLTVNMDPDTCRALIGTVPLTLLQLHGKETPETVAAVRAATNIPVMKAVQVATAADVSAAAADAEGADWLLFDAKPPADSKTTLPGGNAIRFDWALMQAWPPAGATDRVASRPWMLAGGLTADTVAEAVAQSGARVVDVSSAVESAPGVKDPARIRAFLDASRERRLGLNPDSA